MQGKAVVDGRTLHAPIYCEHESLHTSGKALTKEVGHSLRTSDCIACHMWHHQKDCSEPHSWEQAA